MSIIATLTEKNGTYEGQINTLSLKADITITPTDVDGDKAPNYRVHSGDAEIGAGWAKTSDKGKTYISVKLDDPTFVEPIYASLFEGGDKATLIWNRTRRK